MSTLRTTMAAGLLLLGPLAGFANDSAASVAAGGIELRDERRIAMRKERLAIRKVEAARRWEAFTVTVDYEFVNESPHEITTEVAFPVPEYGYEFERPFVLAGFKAWADGQAIPVKKEVRALVAGQDRSALLREVGLDIEHHGNYSPDQSTGDHGGPNQFRTISERDMDRLVGAGLVDASRPKRGWPRWRVAILWHWTQTFPPGRVVRIRHAYTPGWGYTLTSIDADALAGLEDACPDPALLRTLQRRLRPLAETDKTIYAERVAYVLTTANGWKGPIADFELIVERPAGQFVSFCWDGKVEKVSATTFRASVRDFVPKEDLAVYFLRVK